MISERILALKKEKEALILAHYYQRLEIQRIADFVGDSLELAKFAKNCNSDLIIFCGVSFMGETASILNPDKKVVLPKISHCPMASSLKADMVRKAREIGPFVAYVNSTAEVKACADICCTSSNVVKVVEHLNSKEVFLGPDKNLAYFASRKTGKKVVAVPEKGECYVHAQISLEDVLEIKRKHKEVLILVHPECRPEVQETADFIGSTSQMLNFARNCEGKVLAVGTEIGLVQRMQVENPEKKILPIKEVVCKEMKSIRLEDVLQALVYEKPVVKVPENIAKKARKAIEAMLCLSG